ncbi:MAG: DUF362 domain-containing protein [Ignavibacterium sp.]|jgi:hypothetical protein|nr:DUF362 domain-containing protein [Ignavibacterium sp.]
MKSLSKNIYQKKNNKLSSWMLIIAELFLTVNILPQSLPAWEVNNPVSKVFVLEDIPPTAGSLAAGDSTVPDQYLVDPAIDTLLLLMETQGTYLHRTSSRPFGIVGSDDIVIIKGSFQWDFRNTTSTDRIKGLIWQILNHPDGFTGEILVGDNTQWASTGEDDNNSEDSEQCILDVINTFYSKGYPVYLFEWKNIMNNVVTEYSDGDYNDGYPYDPTSKITYPKFLSPSGNHYISLKYGIWDQNSQTYNHERLCIVDFPVLKAHGWTGATLAIKNWIGVLTVAYQNERYGGGDQMHFNYFFSEYALPAKVMQVTFPKLTIIDAAWTNPERNYGNIAIQLNMLLGSTDPFAASWYAAKYMLTPVAYYPDRTNPDNIGGAYNQCLNNWVNCMHDSGFAVTIDSSEISVYNLSIIPVELSAFTAYADNGSVILNWRTSTETNNYGFQVERSNDMVKFEKIAFVPGSGTTTQAKTYSYRDTALTSNENYYRLKQIDLNGAYSYSNIIRIDLNLPEKFALSQNYPNPFNPRTRIKFAIPKESFVNLSIYNAVGELIFTLVAEQMKPGFYEYEFDGSNIPSGVYLYKIKAGDYIDAKKMILAK